jgi:uncharacterized protein with HEPN domain
MRSFRGKVNRYCEGMSQEQFFTNDLVVDAVLRNLELLGETAKQIPDDVRQLYPIVPWRRIAGLRDVLAHAYSGLEEGTIWQAMSQSIPALTAQLDVVVAMEGMDQI